MNKDFFDSICNFFMLQKDVNNNYIDGFSNLIYSLKEQGVYVKGQVDLKLLKVLKNNFSDSLVESYELPDKNYYILFNFSNRTLINSLKLIKFMELINEYGEVSNKKEYLLIKKQMNLS